jgi:hypothetical protein
MPHDGWISPFENMKRVPREIRLAYRKTDGIIEVAGVLEYLKLQNAPHVDTYPGEMRVYQWTSYPDTDIQYLYLRGTKLSDVKMYIHHPDDGIDIGPKIVEYFIQDYERTLVITDIIN